MRKERRHSFASLFVLGHELGMEFHDTLHPVRAWCEESGAEVERVLLLTEAGARDDANTSGVKETEAVEFVCGAVLSGSGFNSLGRQCNSREKVHGTLVKSVSVSDYL
jgi:hypothetical protein